MRVAMYVHNDVSRDSRVLREAAALAAAGHEVVIVGRLPWPADPVDRSGGPGVSIRLVASPPGHPVARAPWREIQSALGRAAGRVGERPAAWPAAALNLGLAVVLIPVAAIRAAWVLLVNRLLGRPINLHLLDFAHRWRVDILDWADAAVQVAPRADVHHAHDLEALPAALKGASRDRGRVVYDKHELFTGKRWLLDESSAARWLVQRWERRAIRQVAGVVTVNEEIAARLERRLHPARLIVVHNCPPRFTPRPDAIDHLRVAAGIDPGTPVAVYHGGFTADRGLRQLAAALRQPGLEFVHAVFLGFGPLHDELIELASDPAAGGHLHVLPAVPPDDLLEWISSADVEVMALQPLSLNHLLSTPNKLFEAIAAGVPVVSSDFPERRRIINDPLGPLGVLVDPTDPAAIASGILEILAAPPAERAALRARCLAAAHDHWNWETESSRLVGLYADLAAATRPVGDNLG